MRRGAQSTEAGNANASVGKRGVQGGDTGTQELHRRPRKVRNFVKLSKEYDDDGDKVSDPLCDGVVRDDGKPSNDSGEGVHEKRTGENDVTENVCRSESAAAAAELEHECSDLLEEDVGHVDGDVGGDCISPGKSIVPLTGSNSIDIEQVDTEKSSSPLENTVLQLADTVKMVHQELQQLRSAVGGGRKIAGGDDAAVAEAHVKMENNDDKKVYKRKGVHGPI